MAQVDIRAHLDGKGPDKDGYMLLFSCHMSVCIHSQLHSFPHFSRFLSFARISLGSFHYDSFLHTCGHTAAGFCIDFGRTSSLNTRLSQSSSFHKHKAYLRSLGMACSPRNDKRSSTHGHMITLYRIA